MSDAPSTKMDDTKIILIDAYRWAAPGGAEVIGFRCATCWASHQWAPGKSAVQSQCYDRRSPLFEKRLHLRDRGPVASWLAMPLEPASVPLFDIVEASAEARGVVRSDRAEPTPAKAIVRGVGEQLTPEIGSGRTTTRWPTAFRRFAGEALRHTGLIVSHLLPFRHREGA